MSARKYSLIDELTSLRFFAAFHVLLFHSGGPALVSTGKLPWFAENFFRNGYLGVSFFFILSGFILTHVYYGRLRGGVASYGLARFARIYPVTCLSMLLMIPFVERQPGMADYWQFMLLHLWPPMQGHNLGNFSNWNMQAWTLSVELFFYLTFPFILWRFEALGSRALSAVLAVLVLVIAVTRLSEIRDPSNLVHPALGYIPMPLLKLPEFMYGVLLGVFHRRGTVPAIARHPLAVPILLALCLLGVFHRRGTVPAIARHPLAVPILLALCLAIILSTRSYWVAPPAALVFGLLIVVIAQDQGEGVIGRWLRKPWMILLGQASFCIYILQLPVNMIVKALLDPVSPLLARFAYIPAMIVFSIILYRYFEEPMREWIRDRFAPRAASAA